MTDRTLEELATDETARPYVRELAQAVYAQLELEHPAGNEDAGNGEDGDGAEDGDE